jgi:ribosomal protein S18 acetylase RimI-like enzyme
MTVVRAGSEADATVVAALHSSEISEGFLSSLGPRFLERLYRRVVRSPQSFLIVAHDDANVVGFVAGTEDVRVLYRSFLLHDGAVASIVALPRLVRSWRRVLETLRYTTGADPGSRDGKAELPAAELLAIAVVPQARDRGTGRQLVDALTSEFERRGISAARVVVGADNTAAIGLYERSGFTKTARIEVHRGTPSEVLTWP